MEWNQKTGTLTNEEMTDLIALFMKHKQEADKMKEASNGKG